MINCYNIKFTSFIPVIFSLVFFPTSQHTDLFAAVEKFGRHRYLALALAPIHGQKFPFHYCGMQRIYLGRWVFGFPKSVSLLVLRSHPSFLCWADRSDHHHGSPNISELCPSFSNMLPCHYAINLLLCDPAVHFDRGNVFHL